MNGLFLRTLSGDDGFCVTALNRQDIAGVPGDAPLIDEAEALQRLGGNKTLYGRVLKSFLTDKAQGNLRDAMAEGDMEKARLSSHSIKGMAANLSLKALYGKAADLENALKAGSADMALYQLCEDCIEQTKSAIEAYLAG